MWSAKQSFIDSVKRALDHDGADQWLSAAEYRDALDEIRRHIDGLDEKARERLLNARKEQP